MPINLILGLALGSPAVSGVGWTPMALGSSLIAWWAADRADLITLNSNKVTSWKDVKAGYDMAQSTDSLRPIYSATSFNGAPGVNFDGTDDYLVCTDAALLAALPIGATPSEMWALASQDAPTVDFARIIASYGGDTSAFRRGVQRDITGAQSVPTATAGNGSGAVNVKGTVDFIGRHVLRGEYGATATAISIDGADRQSGAVVPVTQANRVRIGTNSNTSISNWWMGLVRDVIITTALSAGDAALLQAYLQSKRLGTSAGAGQPLGLLLSLTKAS